MVELKILDETGHQSLQLEPAAALKKAQEVAEQGNKWVFVDGVFQGRPMELTVEDVQSATEITVTETIQEG